MQLLVVVSFKVDILVPFYLFSLEAIAWKITVTTSLSTSLFSDLWLNYQANQVAWAEELG